jgi:hypothetical protein
MTQSLNEQAVVVAAKSQVSCDVGGEAAILSMQNGIYYGLDPIGARVWNLIQQPQSVADLREAILSEYDVEPERCERDLLDLLQALLAEGLIELSEGTGA